MYEQALVRAKELDTMISDGPVGPLHGLPVSLKDNFIVEGVDTTVGFVDWAFQPARKEDESEITKILREAGAVIFCKT